jgi:hypothetical protein
MGRDPVLIDLALQGGGPWGAFAWGVLNRLLEEPWLRSKVGFGPRLASVQGRQFRSMKRVAPE